MEDRFAHVRPWGERRTQIGWWHSFELPEGGTITGVCSLESLKNRIAQFPIAQQLTGKRVLDIGTWDGWFAFEMERRGADVVAIDCWDNPRFREVHSLLHSHVDYRQMDVYELTPESIGRFDIVLFMGVLYHLKHPLLGLERVCALCTDFAAVDSFVIQEKHLPGAGVATRAVMEFYETDEFGGDFTNWSGLSLPCLMAFCRTAGFARVELRNVLEYGACLACYRRWESPAHEAPPGPELIDVFHSADFGINFQSRYDEYVTCIFRCPEPDLTRDDVKPEVSGYGAIPLATKSLEAGFWQADFKVPPGLQAGWHEVKVRVGRSLPGTARRIALDLPLHASSVLVRAICDALTGTPDRVDLRRGHWLSVWIENLPENADRNNVRILAADTRWPVTYVDPAGNPARQINIEVPQGLAVGTYALCVAIGNCRSDPVPFDVVVA